MSRPEHNPYRAPIQARPKKKLPPDEPDMDFLDFIALAKKWERYRLIFNGILVLQTITMSLVRFGLLVPPDLVFTSGVGAFVVNFFFFLGPAMDGYCQWLFNSRRLTFGLIILVAGTLFSMLLAAATVAGF